MRRRKIQIKKYFFLTYALVQKTVFILCVLETTKKDNIIKTKTTEKIEISVHQSEIVNIFLSEREFGFLLFNRLKRFYVCEFKQNAHRRVEKNKSKSSWANRIKTTNNRHRTIRFIHIIIIIITMKLSKLVFLCLFLCSNFFLVLSMFLCVANEEPKQ